MSIEDIEYVERVTNQSLDEEKPLSEVKRARAAQAGSSSRDSSSKIGASIEPPKPDYDWFQFFLSCDVAVGLCERYAQAFAKDSMDESVLPDVDATVLRNLGLREGDIIKVMRHIDLRFGGKENGSAGGLFSGPGGTLRNNTRKGRPAPAVQTSDTIDPKAFSQQKDSNNEESTPTSTTAAQPKSANKNANGFDDDAWDVKPSRQPEPQAKPASSTESQLAPTKPQPPPTQAMQDLSLLQAPLEPIKVQPTTPPPPPAQPQLPVQAQQPQTAPPQIQPQPTGATPAFFTGLGQPANGIQPTPTGSAAPAQPLGLGLGSRQRPTPPQITVGQGTLMPPPPPSRPLSAPQSAQPSGFAPPPLQPQMTGIAPPGQSLNDLNQQRFQQQQYMGGFQPQPTGQGMMQFNTGAGIAQQPGFGNPQFMQPMMTGAPQMQSPFSDPRPQQFSPMQSQPTGFPAGGFNPGQQFPQQTGVNSFLPTALEPQRASIPSPFNLNPQPPTMAPLQPQKTGPPPPVRFGVTEKIAPQPTGRRANLAHASEHLPNYTSRFQTNSSHSPAKSLRFLKVQLERVGNRCVLIFAPCLIIHIGVAMENRLA